MPGLIVFSSGAAWEKAFSEALLFLEQGQGTVLLGPAINSSAEAWLKTRFVPENGVRLGARVLKWTEWVKGKARDRALSLGKGFRPLNGASERERLRIVAQSLTDTGGFYHLHKIWKEERFFSALLKCVLEARMAGLVEKSQWERARDLLGEGPDPLTREAYQDFWTLLEAYEHSLCFQEPERLDQASLLRLAADSDFTDGPFYLLGFEGLALLEVDLLQRMALNSDVLIPLPLDHALMESLIQIGRAHV